MQLGRGLIYCNPSGFREQLPSIYPPPLRFQSGIRAIKLNESLRWIYATCWYNYWGNYFARAENLTDIFLLENAQVEDLNLN